MDITNIKISGFADEINDVLEEQLKGLTANGVKFIEVRGVNGKNISSLTEAEMRDAKAMLDKYEIKVSSIGSPIGKIKITDDFEAHMKVFENVMLAAEILGTKFIRIFSFFLPDEDRKGDGYKKHRTETIRRLEELYEAANKKGLILCHENERDIYGESPEGCLDLMQHFDGRIKFVFDPANFIVGGFVTYPEAFRNLQKYIAYMHIKDASSEGIMPAGLGDGQIKEILTDLYAGGFDSYLSVEPHLSVFTGLEALEADNAKNKLVKNKFKTKDEAFRVAVESLRSILKKV